jgi:ATP-binding cassette subfamily B protein
MNIFRNVRSLAHLNKYLWKYKGLVIWGILFVIVSNFFAVVPAQVVRHAFDLLHENIIMYQFSSGSSIQELITAEVASNILVFAAIIFFMALMKGLFMFMMRQTIIVMSRKVEYDLKNEIYAHFQQLSLSFYRRSNTGDLMARVTEDVSRVRMYLGPSIMYLINLSSLIILTITIMLSVSVKLTLFVLLPLPLLAISIYIVNNITYKRSLAIQNQLSQITTFVQEVFSGIRVIKSFTAAESVKEHFIDETVQYKEKSMAQVKVDALYFPLIMALIGTSTLITLYVGGREVIKGTITPGVIVEFFIYVGLLSWPVASLGWTTSLIQRAAASQTRINELLQIKPEVEIPNNHEKIEINSLQFSNVSLVYPNTGITALKEVDFKINAGEWLGIIGPTGSGKSSIAQLILRTYDPTIGEVFINDQNIKKINLGAYREQIGYVPQDDFLFSDTIAANILFGYHKEDSYYYEKEKIQQLLAWSTQLAGVYNDLMSFPEGFNTSIGERGVTLSGGQKQRMAIARAIINNPSLLVLDDCFSAIDTNTESIILGNLSGVMRGKTSVIISHRVSTVKNCNQIIVVDSGRIIEKGNHHELLIRKGYYASLYKKQLVEKELYENQGTNK